MRGARVLLLAGNFALAAALVATFGSRVGTRLHHDVAYAALALAALLAWPLLRRRRVTSLLLASFASWSLLTGLFLVYFTPDLGHGRWMRWWHGVTSVGFFLVFLAHWARNHPRLLGLSRKLAQRRVMAAAVAGAWTLLVLAGAAVWALPERALRNRFADRYLEELTNLSLAIALGGLLVLAFVMTRRHFRERDAHAASTRNRIRGAVDASLLLAMWLATLTGFPLLYFGRVLRALDAYWLVAAWHVAVSALLVGLVVAHVTFNIRPLKSHAR